MEKIPYLLSALALGALHALEPGHGKTIIASYMIGSRGSTWDAIKLGIIVTITHTAGVFALGLAICFLSSHFVGDTLGKYLQLASSVIVLSIGLSLVRRTVCTGNGAHTHEHPLTSTIDSNAVSLKGPQDIFWLGVSGGIVPCHGALAVLLTTIGASDTGRILWGLSMLGSFSLGLALVITALAIAATRLKQALAPRMGAKSSRLVPALSACLILTIGTFMTIQNLLRLN